MSGADSARMPIITPRTPNSAGVAARGPSFALFFCLLILVLAIVLVRPGAAVGQRCAVPVCPVYVASPMLPTACQEVQPSLYDPLPGCAEDHRAPAMHTHMINNVGHGLCVLSGAQRAQVVSLGAERAQVVASGSRPSLQNAHQLTTTNCCGWFEQRGCRKRSGE